MSEREFAELVAWQYGINLSRTVHELTAMLSKRSQEQTAAQLRHSADAVPAQIADGRSSAHRTDRRRHMQMALSSLEDLELQLSRAHHAAGVSDTTVLNEKIARLRAMLTRLVATL